MGHCQACWEQHSLNVTLNSNCSSWHTNLITVQSWDMGPITTHEESRSGNLRQAKCNGRDKAITKSWKLPRLWSRLLPMLQLLNPDSAIIISSAASKHKINRISEDCFNQHLKKQKKTTLLFNCKCYTLNDDAMTIQNSKRYPVNPVHKQKTAFYPNICQSLKLTLW